MTTRLVPSSAGPARTYYGWTAGGRVALAEATAQWLSIIEIVTTTLANPIPTQPGRLLGFKRQVQTMIGMIGPADIAILALCGLRAIQGPCGFHPSNDC